MAPCLTRESQGYRNDLWSSLEADATSEAGASSMTMSGRRSVGGETRCRQGLVGLSSTVHPRRIRLRSANESRTGPFDRLDDASAPQVG
jgi:hypothetical protein